MCCFVARSMFAQCQMLMLAFQLMPKHHISSAQQQLQPHVCVCVSAGFQSHFLGENCMCALRLCCITFTYTHYYIFE